MNNSIIYNILSNEIKNGYIIHGTNEKFNVFDVNKIKGGFRAKEGYGFYFSDSPYKPMEYGTIFKKVKKDKFNFINPHSPIPYEMFDNFYERDLYKFEELLDNSRNIREYEYYNTEIKYLKEKINQVGNIFNIIQKTIKQYNLTKLGSIEYYIENPQVNIPKLIEIYKYYGYDGYHIDNVYTIFNVIKLNELVEDVELSDKINEIKKNKIKKVRQGIIPYEGGMIGESHPDYEIGFEGDSSFSGYAHVCNGNAGICEDVKPNNINLSSFNIKKSLNPLFWDNDKLNKEIRLKLLDIADEFIKELEISDLEINDITFTGSLANYNWSKKYSDIDLHIILDFNSTGINKEIIKPYFDSQRKLWNIEHSSLKIYNYPIELYVQDINELHSKSGVDSLMKDEWIIEPERHILANEKIDERYVKEKISGYINSIDKIFKYYIKYKNKDKVKLNVILNKANKIYNKIKLERKNALKNDGNEMSSGNIIFKALRRTNYIEKLMFLRKNIKNIINSI